MKKFLRVMLLLTAVLGLASCASAEAKEDGKINSSAAHSVSSQGIFDFPIKDTSVNISCGYGDYKGHNGYDLGVAYGTEVYALFDGNLTYKIRYNMMSDGKYHSWSYGNYCELRANELIDGSSYMMLVAHLSNFDGKNYNVPTHVDGIELICDHGVNQGDRGYFEGLPEKTIGTMAVKKGQLLGYSGSCGNSTGNHLHIGIQKNGSYVNPDDYISNERSAYIGNDNSDNEGQNFTWNGHRYRIYHDTMTWTEAKAYCENLGGHLATITSQAEQEYIESINDGLNCWIGGYRNSGESTEWFWVTGETWSYTNWADGEPNNSSNVRSNETCIAIWPRKWNDLNDKSTEQSGFICEWDEGKEVTFNGHKYRLLELGMTWIEAKIYCENLGGHLVTITDQAEQDVVANLVLSGTKNSYWLGGQKNSSGSWSWIDGSTWKYTNWNSGEPNYDWEDKLMMYRVYDSYSSKAAGKWNNLQNDGTHTNNADFWGTKNIGFVCEWDNNAPEATLTITTTSLPSGTAGQSYSASLASNPSGATWAVASGSLPDGLTLSSSGTISGTPISAGTSDFTVRATYGSASTTQKLSITINAGTITITTSSLPSGKVGSSYSVTLASNQSDATWFVYSGLLPNGLTLIESRGVISGTPTSAGTFSFSIQARNNYASTTKSFSITITSNNNNSGDSGNGGGCESGLGIMSLLLLGVMAIRKSHK